MVHGISGNDGFNQVYGVGKAKQTSEVKKSQNVVSAKPIEFKNSIDRADLSLTLETISGKVKTNSPEGQGLASANEVSKGQLVSGYHFDNINSLGGKYDQKLFELKYSNTDAARVADGTKEASKGVEYAFVASHLQDKSFPFAELFV